MHTTTSPSPYTEALDALADQIGHTPLYEIKRAFHKPGVRLFAKLEWMQMGQSVKARPAFQMIQAAVLSGEWQPGLQMLDATSGNTGIAYASVCAHLGIPLTICLPENASEARKRMLKALGAELILTSPLEGTDGAQAHAAQLVADHPGKYLYLDQYNNPNNWRAHYVHTAREVYNQTQGTLTHFIVGAGTSGTLVGTGRKLKEIHDDIRIIALHPEGALHGLEGWKDMATAKVPGIYMPEIADEHREVSTEDAYDWVVKLARTEGLLVSPSSGANLAGAVKLAEEIDEGVIVTVFPDDASKYAEVMEQLF
ncbi:MAG: PLP-dependent cysteine synthase family protein [Bacteroidota bacterium]